MPVNRRTPVWSDELKSSMSEDVLLFFLFEFVFSYVIMNLHCEI